MDILVFNCFFLPSLPLFLSSSVDRNLLVHSILVHILLCCFFNQQKSLIWTIIIIIIMKTLSHLFELFSTWTLGQLTSLCFLPYSPVHSTSLSQTFLLLSLHNIIIMMMMFVAFQFLILLHSFSSFLIVSRINFQQQYYYYCSTSRNKRRQKHEMKTRKKTLTWKSKKR